MKEISAQAKSILLKILLATCVLSIKITSLLFIKIRDKLIVLELKRR